MRQGNGLNPGLCFPPPIPSAFREHIFRRPFTLRHRRLSRWQLVTCALRSLGCSRISKFTKQAAEREQPASTFREAWNDTPCKRMPNSLGTCAVIRTGFASGYTATGLLQVRYNLGVPAFASEKRVADAWPVLWLCQTRSQVPHKCWHQAGQCR